MYADTCARVRSNSNLLCYDVMDFDFKYNHPQALNRLLIEMAAAPAKFSKAFDRAIDGTDSDGGSIGGEGNGGNGGGSGRMNSRPSSMSPRGRSPNSPISPISGGPLLSPPVIRHMNDAMVEVRFDFNEVAGMYVVWCHITTSADYDTMTLQYNSSPSVVCCHITTSAFLRRTIILHCSVLCCYLLRCVALALRCLALQQWL